jgi:hypothetical protein
MITQLQVFDREGDDGVVLLHEEVVLRESLVVHDQVPRCRDAARSKKPNLKAVYRNEVFYS